MFGTEADYAAASGLVPVVVPAEAQPDPLSIDALLPPECDRLSLASVLRRYGPRYLYEHATTDHERKVLRQLMSCRQPVLGAHEWRCDGCGHTHFTYNGCQNRHCAQCGAVRRVEWLEQIMGWSLPTPYLHLVITVPHELNDLILANRRALYGLLFRAVRETLTQITRQAYDADPGMVIMLHTWSQTILDHFHSHIALTAGGLSLDGTRWVPMRSEDEAFSKPNLGGAFRDRYIDGLLKLYRQGKLRFPASMSHIELEEDFERWLAPTAERAWHTFCQPPPVTSPDGSGVLKYLARYVVGSAITDHRILSDDGEHVTTRMKNYYIDEYEPLPMTGEEFVRRFLLHILPSRMHRLRYAGIYSPGHRKTKLETCRRLLEGSTDNRLLVTEEEPDVDDLFLGEDEPDERRGPPCPRCGMPEMRSLGRLTYDEFLHCLGRLHTLWSSIVTVIIVSSRHKSATPILSPDPSHLSSLTSHLASFDLEVVSFQTTDPPIPDT